MTDNYQEILYELSGKNKLAWLRSGKELIAASNVLYRESEKAADEP